MPVDSSRELADELPSPLENAPCSTFYQGNGQLVLLLAERRGSRFPPPNFFYTFFPPSWDDQNRLFLDADTLWILVSHCREVQALTYSSLRQSLLSLCRALPSPVAAQSLRPYDHSPLNAISSSSVSVFFQFLSCSDNDLSEIEGGFSLLEKGDFTASWACVAINDSLQTGAGTGFRTQILFFCYRCSFQELSSSLKSFDLFPGANWFSLPREAKSLAVHFLGIRCFKSGRGVDLRVSFLNWGGGGLSPLIPFKLWITEHACIFCTIHIQESAGGGADFQILLTQCEEGIAIFNRFHRVKCCFPEMIAFRWCVLSLDWTLEERSIKYFLWDCTNRVSGWIILKHFALSGFNFFCDTPLKMNVLNLF